MRCDQYPPTQVCNHPYCPWCYSRLAHNFADKMGYGDPVKFARMTSSSRFLGMGRRIEVSLSSSSIDPLADLVKAVKGEASTCRAYSVLYRDSFWASTWQVTIEPVGAFGQAGAGWLVAAKFFALLKASATSLIERGLPNGWAAQEVDPSKEYLEQSLRALYTYPVGFVTGDPELSRLAVLSRKKRRLRESTGWFLEPRKETSEVEEADDAELSPE